MDGAFVPLAGVNLDELASALGDNDGMTSWWFDPATGEVTPLLAEGYGDADDEEDEDPSERGWVFVEPEGSRAAYREMQVFAEAVGDPRARDLLLRALEGRGAFRRFRDTMFDFPSLRDHWFTFRDACGQARAIEWLDDHGLVAPSEAQAAQAGCQATAEEVLALVSDTGGVRVEAGEVVTRWDEVVAALEAGETVTLLRGGRPWATVQPL